MRPFSNGFYIILEPTRVREADRTVIHPQKWQTRWQDDYSSHSHCYDEGSRPQVTGNIGILFKILLVLATITFLSVSCINLKGTPLWLAQRSHWHRCHVHSGVIDTAVTCTAESLAPLSRAQRSHWHRCDMHSGVIDTAVTCTAESLTPLCRYANF
jgi:hypothetical protein